MPGCPRSPVAATGPAFTLVRGGVRVDPARRRGLRRRPASFPARQGHRPAHLPPPAGVPAAPGDPDRPELVPAPRPSGRSTWPTPSPGHRPVAARRDGLTVTARAAEPCARTHKGTDRRPPDQRRPPSGRRGVGERPRTYLRRGVSTGATRTPPPRLSTEGGPRRDPAGSRSPGGSPPTSAAATPPSRATTTPSTSTRSPPRRSASSSQIAHGMWSQGAVRRRARQPAARRRHRRRRRSRSRSSYPARVGLRRPHRRRRRRSSRLTRPKDVRATPRRTSGAPRPCLGRTHSATAGGPSVRPREPALPHVVSSDRGQSGRELAVDRCGSARRGAGSAPPGRPKQPACRPRLKTLRRSANPRAPVAEGESWS